MFAHTVLLAVKHSATRARNTTGVDKGYMSTSFTLRYRPTAPCDDPFRFFFSVRLGAVISFSSSVVASPAVDAKD